MVHCLEKVNINFKHLKLSYFHSRIKEEYNMADWEVLITS